MVRVINKKERNILTRLVKVVCKLQDPHYMAVNCRFEDKENSYRLVIQCFPVVYCGINHMSLVFHWNIYKLLGQCVCKEKYKHLISGILHGTLLRSIG